MSTLAPANNVVVLGAGGAGVAVAQTLSKKLNHAQYNLILVDMRPYMVWLPAGARAVVTHDEAFTDTVRFSLSGVLIRTFETSFRRSCFPMTRSSRQERGFSSRYIAFLQLSRCGIVTQEQGKVVTINEANDQRGGKLTFENGEVLSYEGESLQPSAFTRSVHLE